MRFSATPNHLIVVLFASAAGCTTYYQKPGGTDAEFQADLAQCVYQAKAAIAGYSGGSGHSYATAIGTGVAQGMELGFREVELRNLCLQSKGWAKGRAPSPQRHAQKTESPELTAANAACKGASNMDACMAFYGLVRDGSDWIPSNASSDDK